MTLTDALRVLRRRWPVLVIGVLAAVLVLFGITRKLHASYRGTQSVLLVAPPIPPASKSAQSLPLFQNPFFLEGGQLRDVANIITNVANDDATTSELARQGATATYSVAPGVADLQATVDISASGPSDQTVARTVAAVADAIQHQLLLRQQSLAIPPASWIRSQPLGTVLISVDHKNRFRTITALAAVTLALTLVAAFGVERFRSPTARSAEPTQPGTRRRRIGRRPRDNTLPRWYRKSYVVILGLVVIAAASGLALKKVQPMYEAQSSLSLLPPTFGPLPGAGSVPFDQNPLYSNDWSINTFASLTAQSVMSGETADAIRAKGGTAPYNIQNFREGTSGQSDVSPTAVLYITATAHTPDVAAATVDQVAQAARQYVSQRQSILSAPPSTWVSVVAITPSRVYQLHGSRIRAAAGLLILGLVGIGVARRTLEHLLRRSAACRLKTSPAGGDRPNQSLPEWHGDLVTVGSR